jgi:hypothetical protein
MSDTLLTLAVRSEAASQHYRTGHSCIAQHLERLTGSSAGLYGIGVMAALGGTLPARILCKKQTFENADGCEA